jgi:D-arabinose 1-dehydrogenase-like Zn-dependent alcohol dehydrogenase
VSGDNLSIPAMGLILNGISVVGSMVATRVTQLKMLEFASFHNISP